MNRAKSYAEVWEEDVVIPTYGVGKPDKNPMFFEKRVYQGSQGKVYPYPVVDKILDEKENRCYCAVFLENDYLKVMVLPQLGGRIQRALDKTNNYDFVYHNEVIKPALVGLTGPWISGGIEFNWPQHHRPSTYQPLEYKLLQEKDAASVLISEVDRMYGTKGMMTIRLRPGRAYIEIEVQLFNPTPLPQTFLWWANPAVEAHEQTQSIFPPDVRFVMDHGKRDVSGFPIARGSYYKYDYSPGTDISRYWNIPVPTSFMAHKSDYDFVGGYDYRREAGILHVANHHISPGKKQWTWGNGDFGRAWDRNLTDHNGPYVELMTGVFTDNQPDFTWLMPGEEKRFVQRFLPYKAVGQVANANEDFVLGLERQEGSLRLSAYSTAVQPGITLQLTAGEEVLFSQTMDLSPETAFVHKMHVNETAEPLVLSVLGQDGTVLLKTLAQVPEHEIAMAATAMPAPEEIPTVEELCLAGQHLEQYRHATRSPVPYYLEGLRREGDHAGCNNAYGTLLLRWGLFEQSEQHFRRALKRLTWKNPNPQDGSASFGLGLSLYYQGRLDEAYDAFYKATWSAGQQTQSFYYLASISARQGRWQEAVRHGRSSLSRNYHNMKSRGLVALALHRMGDEDSAKQLCEETLQLDPFTQVCRLLMPETAHEVKQSGARVVINTTVDLLEAGCADMAAELLEEAAKQDPLAAYYLAWVRKQAGLPYESALQQARELPLDYCFPNRLEDLQVLSFALEAEPQDGAAAYCLGNLLYDKQRYQEAADCWQIAARQLPELATPLRNLAIYTYNKLGEPQQAISLMEEAFARDPIDARVLLELDQLRKRSGIRPEDRLKALEVQLPLVYARDDLLCEYVTLLNLSGRHQKALDIALHHHFHPWEGGEGKITGQYALALRELAIDALSQGEAKQACELLTRALTFPENLGEGKLIGAKDNDLYYWLGRAWEAQGNAEQAHTAWRKALEGQGDLGVARYYNDQPAEMLFYAGLAYEKLKQLEAAKQAFKALKAFGQQHLNDKPELDYFAVSLPDMQVFDADLDQLNREHCLFLMALGHQGLGDEQQAAHLLDQVLQLDPAHTGAAILKQQLQKRRWRIDRIVGPPSPRQSN